MTSSSPRHLLPLVLGYLPVPIGGAILSARWNVGASAEGGPRDMFLRGTALTPPLFLPALLLVAAIGARRGGPARRASTAAGTLIASAFLAGSTLNLPNDFAAAKAAGTPTRLTAGLAAVHVALSLALLYNALPTLLERPSGRAG